MVDHVASSDAPPAGVTDFDNVKYGPDAVEAAGSGRLVGVLWESARSRVVASPMFPLEIGSR